MTESDNFISSKDNPNIKVLKKLQRKKFRDELNRFVIENPLTIRDGLKHGVVITELYTTSAFEHGNAELYNNIIQNISPEYIYQVEEKIFSSVVSLEQPQGIAAEYEKPPDSVDVKKPIVFLNGVSDPGNVGTIMRSCAAFGIKSVIGDQDSADFFNPKTLSAAKESVFLLSLLRNDLDFLSEIKKRMPVYALNVTGGVLLRDVEWKHPFCLVLGSEVHGISKEIKEIVDTFITIQMTEGGVESLNVAASAAIALHAANL